MKNATHYIAVLATLFFFATGCKDSFLEVPPTGALEEPQLATKEGIEGSLTASYAVLTGRHGSYTGASNWFWGSILGGDANKGSNSGDQAQMNEVQRYATLGTNVSLASKYRSCYEGIVRANTVLSLLSKTSQPIPDADKKRMAGEARFLRGHYFFELKKIFNNTPYIDENTGKATVKNDKDLWPKIEADFQFAYDNLPEKTDLVGRANKWAAGAYLAKTYLYQGKDNKGKVNQEKYAAAKRVFDEVIANGKTSSGVKYALMPKYGDLFRLATSDNNQESIFQIQTAVNTGSGANNLADFGLNFPYGSSAPGGCCGFFQPSFELVNSFRTNADGLPLLDGSYNTERDEVKSDYGIAAASAFTPDAGNLDPRLDHSAGRRGIPYLNWGNHAGKCWIRDQSFAGPYSPKKFMIADGDIVEDRKRYANNFPIIRYADVLLMAAEAEVEARDLEKAREYVNKGRGRAPKAAGFVTKDDGPPAANYKIDEYKTPWTDQEFARKAVRFERKLELSGEGHRFFDLVRWGIAKETLDAYLAYEGGEGKLKVAFGGASFTVGKSEYQPIPQAERDIVGADNLLQNTPLY